jgi:hypothetical protein
MSSIQKARSPVGVFFVIFFFTKRWIPNRSDESRIHLDEYLTTVLGWVWAPSPTQTVWSDTYSRLWVWVPSLTQTPTQDCGFEPFHPPRLCGQTPTQDCGFEPLHPPRLCDQTPTQDCGFESLHPPRLCVAIHLLKIVGFTNQFVLSGQVFLPI